MRLTAYTDYALRVLMRLALQPDRLTTIADLAKGYDISENHLMKVVHQLGVAGLIDTVRGRNGGLRLRKPPAAIGVGRVVRLMEPDMDIVPCFNDSSGRVIEPACLLKGALAEARDAFLAALDRYTLADLVKPRRRLSALFRDEPRHA
jgi:Rrf2 family transcriptional regulator, nitric oxide-sensitive transcriptional repressor